MQRSAIIYVKGMCPGSKEALVQLLTIAVVK